MRKQLKRVQLSSEFHEWLLRKDNDVSLLKVTTFKFKIRNFTSDSLVEFPTEVKAI